MPGLFGWIDLGGQHTAAQVEDAPALLAEMARRMSHTGDEVVERWTDLGRGFAVARIGPPGNHSVAWPGGGGGDDHVFVDGVLHGDPDPAGFARRGVAALPSLRGFFAVARWEPGPRRLTLAVDRRASRPLAWTVVRGALYFAPEVKALLAVPGVDRALDEAALGVFLGAGYLLAHQTLFAGVRRLGGGEALVAGPDGVRVEPYVRYTLSASGDGTPAKDLEMELAETYCGAVERNLADVDHAVVFLSGGVDSRAIAAAAQDAARRRGKTVRTVTWASPEARPGSDLFVAAQVAEALGTRHHAVFREVAGYGARLRAVTYLLDGLTDVAAYHPHEHAVMRDLAQGGARMVLRGDECFGWEQHVGSVEEALISLNLREVRPLRLLDRLVRPALYARLCDASAEALAEVARPLDGAHPDDAKDLLYFRHRLQGYLGSAAYLKQVALDHRAPLLDEALLDFNARVPARLRVDKRLFCRAAARAAPEIFRIPLAERGNLEDWGALLASASPVRAHVEEELADTRSGIWEMFDRRALAALLPPLGRPPGRSAAVESVRRLARTGVHLAPPLERALVTRSHRAALRVDQACLRIMVLKAWHDMFVSGDGARGVERQGGGFHATLGPP
jgi:asparagine synthase (glutamine-hydrolysing)